MQRNGCFLNALYASKIKQATELTTFHPRHRKHREHTADVLAHFVCEALQEMAQSGLHCPAQCYNYNFMTTTTVNNNYCFGVGGCDVGQINKVALRRARLMGWVIVSGFNLV